MKAFVVIFLTLLPSAFLTAQKVSLRSYCPNDYTQYKGTCYAYATTYIAASAAFNIRDNITDETAKKARALSDGYIASKRNQELKPLIRAFSCCGINSTFMDALRILKNNGTYYKENYKEGCVKHHVDAPQKTDELHRIKDYDIRCDLGNNTERSIQWIKEQLDAKRVVVCAIESSKSLMNFQSSTNDLIEFENVSNHKPMANHVICITGYDETTRQFEIRNNFKNWGYKDSGFAKIKYSDFLSIADSAGVILLD
ncbi:MAG: hypothetical protein U0T73_07760 [Chitinophagales bacterium]